MYLANHVLVIVCILEEAQARGSRSNESTLLSEVHPRIDTLYSYLFETKPGKLGIKKIYLSTVGYFDTYVVSFVSNAHHCAVVFI